MKKNGLSLVLAFVLVLLLVWPICAATTPTPKITDLSFATYSSGGQTYMVSVAIAEMAKKYAGLRISVEPSEGPPTWMPLLKKGEVDLGYGTSAELYEAYLGIRTFEKNGKQPIRLVASTYGAQHVIYSRPDAGIKAIPDMRGKRISIYTPAALSLNIVAPLALEAFGLQPKRDYIAITHSGPEEKKQALIEGRIDAYWHTFPGPHGLEVKRAVGLVVIPIPEKSLQYISEKTGYPIYSSVIRAELAKLYGIPQGLTTFTYGSAILCREDLPEEPIYEILKAVYDHFDEFAKFHARTAESTLEQALTSPPIPFHGGAIKYYKEKKLWTPQLEDLQKKLLDKGK